MASQPCAWTKLQSGCTCRLHSGNVYTLTGVKTARARTLAVNASLTRTRVTATTTVRTARMRRIVRGHVTRIDAHAQQESLPRGRIPATVMMRAITAMACRIARIFRTSKIVTSRNSALMRTRGLSHAPTVIKCPFNVENII